MRRTSSPHVVAIAWPVQEAPRIVLPRQGDGASNKKAKMLCQQCPVLTSCLEHALQCNERYGIWGGMSPAERQSLRKARRSGSAA